MTVTPASLPAIRKADAGDATRLARFAEETFRETFGAVNAADDMDRYCRASFGEAIQASEIRDPGRVTLLSEDGGRLVGFAQLRWDAAPSCVAAARPGEIQRLYVASDRHGAGVARGLMEACLTELQARGSDLAWLGVSGQNSRAIAFYRKFGFAAVGEHEFLLGQDSQRDIVMARGM